MEIGRVKSFNSSLGYGFIKPDDGSADVIFHVSRIEVNNWEPGEGHRVTYEIGTNPHTLMRRGEHVRPV